MRRHCCPVHGDRTCQKWLSYKGFSIILGGVDFNSTTSAGAVLPADLADSRRNADRRDGLNLHVGGHSFGQSILNIVDRNIGFEIDLRIRSGNIV